MRQQQFVGSTRGAETRHLLSREILVQIDVLVMASFEHRVIITDAVVTKVDVSQEPQAGLYGSMGSRKTYRCSTGASAVAT